MEPMAGYRKSLVAFLFLVLMQKQCIVSVSIVVSCRSGCFLDVCGLSAGVVLCCVGCVGCVPLTRNPILLQVTTSWPIGTGGYAPGLAGSQTPDVGSRIESYNSASGVSDNGAELIGRGTRKETRTNPSADKTVQLPFALPNYIDLHEWWPCQDFLDIG